ncbi:HNH endonuclease [Thermophilibacter provencensis]|uniref:HNH endonuclease signature motif containing protein n=1 Tax=Thermophilibacter provencensis TaxID=1852386 RepID=UPI002942D070|nr:HNH endonuclease [Thermophilibacter provencensis]
MPSDEEIALALEALGMDALDVRCAYCGDPATEWDHLNAIVLGKRPTGYISEIHNLVPACGKCNQSKGNKPWRSWMFGPSPLSPASRGVGDIEERAEKIADYERRFPPVRIDFEAVVNGDLWKAYWDAHRDLIERMMRCEELATAVRAEISSQVESLRDRRVDSGH